MNRPAVGRKGCATPQKAEDEKAPMAGRAADMGAYLYDVPDEARAFLHSPGWRGGGLSRAQGRALRLTRPGPPFCLPAHRLPPPPAQRPVHAAARRSAVVVVFALCGKEGGGNQQRQRLGRHNGKPDAVQPDKGGQRQHYGHLKHECAQK